MAVFICIIQQIFFITSDSLHEFLLVKEGIDFSLHLQQIYLLTWQMFHVYMQSNRRLNLEKQNLQLLCCLKNVLNIVLHQGCVQTS